jgi:hypothetical protein
VRNAERYSSAARMTKQHISVVGSENSNVPIATLWDSINDGESRMLLIHQGIGNSENVTNGLMRVSIMSIYVDARLTSPRMLR